MADIQYLNYGDLQIELLAFLNKAANEVLAYVLNLSWSKKRKEKFMSAYSDLMNRGILGASNSSGQWMIDVGGDALPFDTMSEKDKEMYQEAAYFIQQQMQGLPTRTLEEEKKEEDKTKLPLFDNKAFTSSFINHISTSDFGGQDFHIGGENDNWNKLDARDSNGIRGKQKRTEALKNYLISYRDKFDDSKYNFEGGPFENAQDFRNRLDNAINALNTPNADDDEQALNKLGLNPADWFNNGSGDPSGKFLNDKELTYAELAEYNLKQNELKQLLLKELARNNFLSFGTKTSPKLVGRNPVELKTKYGDGNGLLNALYGYSLRGLKDLNADELSELQGAYRHLAKDPIDNNLLKQLLGSSSGLYRGASPNRFKKINGIDNFIWDSTTGQVIQIQNRDEYEAFRNLPVDLFANVKTLLDEKQEYLGTKGMTTADIEELTGIGLDIASIIDPEPWSAGGLGVAAAFSRNLARAQEPGKWGAADHLWNIFDYATGALGFIPLLGDAGLAIKVGKNAAKVLKRLMLVPAFVDAVTHSKGAYTTVLKFINGEDLTVEDYMNLGSFIRGFTGAYRGLTAGNRASRTALLLRGYLVSNRWDKKLGLTKSKPIGTSTPTVKLTINGRTEEIPISADLKSKLDVELSKAGNDVAKRSEIIRNNAGVLDAAKLHAAKLKAENKQSFEVTDANGKIANDWKNAEVVYNGSLRNARLFGGKWGLTPKWARNSGGSFGELSNFTRGQDNLDAFLSQKRSLWNKFKYGSNRAIRGMDRYNNAVYGTSSPVSQNLPSPQTSTNNPSNPPEKSVAELRKSVKSYLEGTAKHSGNNLSEEPFKAGDFNFEVDKFPNSPAGNIDISFNGKVMESISFNNLKDMMKKVADFLQKNRRLKDASGTLIKKINTKEMGEILKLLKAKGVFKQGGTINRLKIQNYKEFINK